MPVNPSDVELVAVVIGLISTVRKQYPQVDGLKFVLPLALLLALAVCYVAAPQLTSGLGIRAVRVAVGAVGTVSTAGYLFGKLPLGKLLEAVAPPPAPPADPGPGT